MALKREQILGASHVRLEVGLAAALRRNEALTEGVPADGLVIVRDGDPGEPDATLNPRNRDRGPQWISDNRSPWR